MSQNRDKIQQILFEYAKPISVYDSSDIDACHRRFVNLENYLDKIWAKRSNGTVYGENTEVDEKSINQPFLKIIHRDYSLASNQYVGLIQNGDFRLTLLPKIFQGLEGGNVEITDRASRNLMYLMSYADDLKVPEAKGSFAVNKMDFIEMFIFLFAQQTLQTFKHDFYHCYERVEENLGFVKGKIIFQEHLKHNLYKGRNDKIFCRYTVFQENNIFNQIIKFVTRSLIKNTKNNDNKNLLRQILHLLVDVDDRVCIYSDTEKVVFNRTQNEFESILNYCRLFLSGNLIKFTNKDFDIFCFLLDMNVLFEKFVAGFIKKHFPTCAVEIQKSDKYVAENESGEKVFRMQHDIYLTSGNRNLIIDTKYKDTDFEDKKGNISQTDIYQMATYAIRRGCNELILIYPKFHGDDSRVEANYTITDEFSKEKIKLKCFKLDLTDLKGDKRQKDVDIKRQLEGAISIVS